MREITDINISEKQIADHFGFYSQSRKCIEECAELIEAINKYWNALLDADEDTSAETLVRFPEYRSLIEELADTQVMIDQMIYLVSCKETMHAVMFNKIARTLERMKNERDTE